MGSPFAGSVDRVSTPRTRQRQALALLKSLIHTTYFDQPEVADMLAEHIATEARAAG